MNTTFLDIIRWRKLLYIAVIQFLFKICFLEYQGLETRLSYFQFSMLSLSTLLVLSSGYLTSFTVRNQSSKYAKYKTKNSKIGAIITGVLGVFFCVFVSFSIDKPLFSLIGLIGGLLVFLYSYRITRKTFFTNIINSFIKAVSVLLVWWFDTPVQLNGRQWEVFFKLQLIMVFYIFLSFVGSMIRETIRDIVNINEDHIHKNQTIPIVFGRKRAKNIILLITIIACLSILSAAILFIQNQFILLTILFLGVFPQLYFVSFLLTSNTKRNFESLLRKSDFVFVFALISVPVIAYYFKHVFE